MTDKPQFARGVQIIETTEMHFAGKDLIYIKNIEDFNWLLGSSSTIFKLGECYYSIADSIAFIYEFGEGKNGQRKR